MPPQATATRVLDNYIGGQWTAAADGERLDVTNPATGEVLVRVPLSSAAELDAAVEAARAALPAWRDVSVIQRARHLFALREGLDARREDLAQSVTTEMGKTIADARAEVARMIEMVECACAIPTTMQGRVMEDVSRGVDCETVRQPVGVCAAIVPVQLPGDGPVLVPAVCDRMRQRLHPEALRAGADDPADRLRGARRARPAAGGRQPRKRRTRGRRGDPRASGNRRGQLRRLRPGRADRLRALRPGRQAGAGARRRQEPHGRDAGRRRREDRRRDHRLGLRRRRTALHGRLGSGHRRRSPSAPDSDPDRAHRAHSASATATTSRSTSARSSRRPPARGSATRSSAASGTERSCSSTAGNPR